MNSFLVFEETVALTVPISCLPGKYLSQQIIELGNRPLVRGTASIQ